MKSEHWTQAKKILPIVRELPREEERAAFLDEACGDDLELRREIESFLATDPAALAFMDRPPLKILGEAIAEGNESLQENSRVGAYRILRQLGSGGMGIVYLATRVGDEFKREVAIKVLLKDQAGQASEGAELRFLQEMGILAKLNHPNIAKLHEGGRTEDGRLYYLMEYVEGKRIDAYCREKKLSLEDRLRLFQKVCAAVQYAHTQLVIHRDIKPSNVLVTAEGEPKLLDFGVAKPLEGAGVGAGTTVLTGGDQKLYTPDYASPEQIAGQDIHTASDVYSLGILLYELLAGDRPYRLTQLAEKEIQRIVCEQTPVPPSTALVETSNSEPSEDSPATDPTTATFRRKIEGDLDTIVLMALRKLPGERYVTVEKLASDIEKHLAGHAIDAREPSFGYKAWKFVRRNRVGIGIAALFLLVIGVAAWALVEQYQKTVRERDRAQQVTDFMVEVFGAADPDEVGDEGPSARQLLDGAKERVLVDFENDPKLKADLLAPIAHSYGGLGLHREASELGARLIALLSELYGPQHEKTAEALTRTAISDVYSGDFDRATARLDEALTAWLSSKGEVSLEYASALDYLGVAQRRSGLLAEAEATQRRTLEIRRSLLGQVDPLVSASLNNLATVLQVQGKYKEAMPLAKEGLEIDKATVGDAHPNYFAALIGVGILSRKSGDLEAAEQYLSESIELGDLLYPDGHPHLAAALNAYALLQKQQGKNAGAEDLYRRSLEMDRKILGPGNPASAITVSNLAIVLEAQGRLQEARDLYETAIADLERVHGRDNPDVLAAQAKYGHFLWNAGEREQGIAIVEEVVRKRRTHFASDAPVIATDLQNLAFYRQMQGRAAEAEPLCREALRIDQEAYKDGHRQIVRDQHRLASILEELGEYIECEGLAKAALNRLQELLAPDHWRLADAQSVLGGCLAGQGRIDEARPLLEGSFEFLKEDRGEDAWQAEGAERRLAYLLQTRF